MRLSPHPFTLRQLQYVVAVADEKSFRRAAALCHVSQPSLSAQIAQVEDAIGAQLFERDRRHVRLTPAGEDVTARARALLVSADDLVDVATRFSDPFSGTLRIGAIPTIAPYLLPEVAAALRAKYPSLTVVWVEDRTAGLATRLAAAELDAALVALVPELSSFEHAEIGRDPFLLATPPGHALSASSRPARAEDIDGERVLLLDDGHCFREQALAFCARSGASELGFRATSLATLTQMVAGGTGVTLLPRLAAATENRLGELHLRAISPRTPSRTLALVWRKGSPMHDALGQIAGAMRAAYARREPLLEKAVHPPPRAAQARRK
jgi:LysR family hydrogen peroxide-inducible transcriptional activator